MKISDVLNYLVAGELNQSGYVSLRGKDVAAVTAVLDLAIVDVSSTLQMFTGMVSLQLTAGVYHYTLSQEHSRLKGTGKQFYVLDTSSSPLPSRINAIIAVYDSADSLLPINILHVGNTVALANRTTLQFKQLQPLPNQVHVEYCYDPEPVVCASWEECLERDYPLPHNTVHAVSLFVASRLLSVVDSAAALEQGQSFAQRYAVELNKLKNAATFDVLPSGDTFYARGWI